MKTVAVTIVWAALLMFVAVPALADWKPGDGHKMHFPQLPDPTGWDVEIFRIPIADDWQCSQTGPVTDIHFWTSWQGDNIGQIGWLDVTIYDNDVTSAPHSQPGNPLWSETFDASEFSVPSLYGQGDQGFYDPPPAPWWQLHDHSYYQQINIENILDPFPQQEGEIYWLAVSADWTGTQASVGWKTSDDHFQDIAVYWDYSGVGAWVPLYDPSLPGQVPLSLAFVITPEPTTLSLLALGGLALMRRRRQSFRRRREDGRGQSADRSRFPLR